MAVTAFVAPCVVPCARAAESHSKGRAVAPPTQLGTAAVNYMTSAFDGSTAVSTVVTLSQAPKCGWETWFACNYAEDVAKLRMPTSGRVAKPTDAAKATTRAAVMSESTKVREIAASRARSRDAAGPNSRITFTSTAHERIRSL